MAMEEYDDEEDLTPFLAFAERGNEDRGDPDVVFRRVGAIPSHETFSIKPIREFVERHLALGPDAVIIDPFARNSRYGTITNDLNPNTTAEYHLDAREFLTMLIDKGVEADAVILDPPYSPYQIVECYKGFGLKAGGKDVQIASLFRECKNKLTQLLRVGGVALTFGWTSAGFGRRRGFSPLEILLVYHGAGRNDTICVAERKHHTVGSDVTMEKSRVRT